MTMIATSRLLFWDGVLLCSIGVLLCSVGVLLCSVGVLLCSMPPLSALNLGGPAEF